METLTNLEMEVWAHASDTSDADSMRPFGLVGSQLELLSGFVAGVAGIATGHPLDTVRIRQQTAPTSEGTFARLFKIMKTEGALSPFRGMSPPLVASGFQNALLFATFAPTLRYLSSDSGISSLGVRSHLTQAFLAGCVAGAAQTVVTAPSELIKIRMQTSDSKFSNSMQCLTSSVRAHGLRGGLFKGFGITFLRDCPNIGIYFGSYEWLKGLLHPSHGTVLLGNSELSGNLAVLLAGGSAGILSWALSYPIDVIKTRIQADTTGKYRGMLHATRESVRVHGWSILFKGFSACMYRAFIVNAVTFAAFEETRRRFSL